MKPFFFFLLFIGLAIRLATAASHIDLIFPDEHYQTLEPASSVVFGYGWKSWEWYYGIRSWLVPGLYMPLLFILKLCGITSGSLPIIASQSLNAVGSAFMLWQFARLLADQKFHPLAQLFSLLFFTLTPAMIVWGVSTFSDTWAMCALWMAIPYVLRTLDGADSRKWFCAGALLGVTFTMRLQMITWFAGFVLALLIFLPKNQKRLLGPMLAGYLVPIFFQGVLDYLTWGYFLYSPYKSVQMNIFEGVANSNGVSPWSFYFIQLGKNFGPLACLFFVLSIGLSFFSKKMDLKTKSLLMTSIFYFLAHLLIGHKELRFILPIIPMAFYMIAYGFNEFITRYLNYSLPGKYFYPFVFALTVISWTQVYTPAHYSSADLSELSLAIQKDGHLRKYGGCLLFVDHYWIWSRGEMLQGHPVQFVEVKASELGKQNMENCTYALMPSWSEKDFLAVSRGQWEKFKTDAYGNIAYRKIR